MEFRIHKLLSVLALSTLVACGQQYDFGLPESSDEFGAAATYNNKVDMVFIVDNSESMKYAQENLSKAIPGMIQKLMAAKLDLHIVVVSTSMGGEFPTGGKFLGSPRILTSGTPNLQSVLASRLSLGIDGRPTEAGLASLFTALSPYYLSNEGAGFLREDALLAIMEITNEDDKSALGSVEEYAQALDEIKPRFANGDRAWVFNLIATLDTNPTCATNPDRQYTERADILMNLARASNGQMESICSSDFTNAVTNIRTRIVQILSDFKLTRVPDLATVRVYMNGALVPRSSVNGWDYIADKNLIRFFGTWLPSADSKIRVDFTPASAD